MQDAEPRTSDAPVLRVAGLGHRFGALDALADVSLDVQPGTFTALLGINGAGKTTLFNLITRLYASAEGRIEICGHDVRADPRAALSRLGVVFQSRSLDATLSVRDNFLYQGALHGMDRRAVLHRAKGLLERMKLEDLMGRKVVTLSGGQARRVEIARALLHAPRLLLCDEATVGLDVQARTDIVTDMHVLARDEGAGVLWATHLIDEIGADDPVILLHKGRVLVADRADGIAGEGTLEAAFLALTGQEGTP